MVPPCLHRIDDRAQAFADFSQRVFDVVVNAVGAVRATMLGTSEPVMATITAVAWAGETFTFTDLTGFAMIIIMVFLVR